MHPVRMPRQRLETASAGHLPQLDRTIIAPAGQGAAVGGKSQSIYPVGMSLERLHTESWLGLLDLPHPNLSIQAATGQQVSVRTPGYYKHRTRMRQRLELCATLEVPED